MPSYAYNKIRKFNCQRCGIQVITELFNQKFCGSRQFKRGCAYQQHLDNVRKCRYKYPTSRAAVNAASRRFYRKHLEEIRQQRKERRLVLRFAIFEKFGFACQYCGKKAPEVVLEVDHIIPKAKGGKNDINNYTVACRDCNYGKKDSILTEFGYQQAISLQQKENG